jgi:hypothetical protein
LTGTNPTTIELKAWADGNSEPGTWTYTTTDSDSNLQVTGQVGLRINLPSATSNAPVLFSFDDFSVTTTDATPTPTVSPSPTPTAPPQSGLIFWADTFTRSSTSNWGTPDTGGSYVITSGVASSFNTDGSVGTINSPTSAVSRSLVVNNSYQRDVDIKFESKVDKVPTGNALEVYWIARYQDPDNHYRGKIRFTGGSSITVQASKVVGGTETLLGAQTTTGVNLSADTYVWIRTQITGASPTTINMKVWDVNSTEPVDWQYTITDSESVLQSSGSVGIRTNAPSTISNAPILVSFDNVNATTADGSVNSPSAPVQSGTTIATDTFTRSTANG